ncbi:MAG: hypothetical protein ABT10_19670 [Novosphingobium sp. SCN 63-17]|nr:MAG: hypothetical protein ABT10_19670 [Novosphingobium sp. SCN 63-17]OJX89027.1 MAG: hypothetical protein BGP00_12140 [Novosphingobium sp. 63-713]
MAGWWCGAGGSLPRAIRLFMGIMPPAGFSGASGGQRAGALCNPVNGWRRVGQRVFFAMMESLRRGKLRLLGAAGF